MDMLVKILPALAPLKKHKDERVELVSDVIVEEVLQDLGVLDFGKGISGKTNVALWRARGDHRPRSGSSHTNSSSNDGTISTKRSETAARISSAPFSEQPVTGYRSEPPRPESSTA